MDDRLTVQEAATALDATAATVRHWIARGALAAETRADGTAVIRRAELRRAQFRQAARTAIGRAAAEPWPTLDAPTVTAVDAASARPARAGLPFGFALLLASAVVAVSLSAVLIRESGLGQVRWGGLAFALAAPVSWFGWALAAGAVRDARDHRESGRWPAAAGRVVASRVAVTANRLGPGSTLCLPTVTYVFATGGIAYRGDRVAFALGSMVEEDAQEVCSFFAAGAEVPVWHHPTDLRRAVLVRYAERSDLIIRLLGGVALAIGAPIAAVLVSMG